MKKHNNFVYCKDFRVKCWNWSKKKKETPETLKKGVTTSKLSENELKAYIEELNHKEIRRVKK